MIKVLLSLSDQQVYCEKKETKFEETYKKRKKEREADRTFGVNCFVFSIISSGTA